MLLNNLKINIFRDFIFNIAMIFCFIINKVTNYVFSPFELR